MEKLLERCLRIFSSNYEFPTNCHKALKPNNGIRTLGNSSNQNILNNK